MKCVVGNKTSNLKINAVCCPDYNYSPLSLSRALPPSLPSLGTAASSSVIIHQGSGLQVLSLLRTNLQGLSLLRTYLRMINRAQRYLMIVMAICMIFLLFWTLKTPNKM